jgi:hypothetical protein
MQLRAGRRSRDEAVAGQQPVPRRHTPAAHKPLTRNTAGW